MVRWLYSFLWYLILPLLLLRLIWRSRRNPGYRHHWAERFACAQTPELASSIWIHAVSVGEMSAMLPLISSLAQCYPQLPLLVTTMTPTGREFAQKNLGNTVKIHYLPYDYPQAIKRFLRQNSPQILILAETELWPNLLYYTQRQNIPIIIANARLSKRSFAHYYRARFIIRPMLTWITWLAAQTAKDAHRFRALGLASTKIQIVGNLKFDLALAAETLAQAVQLRSSLGSQRPIWVAASTHPAEEELILAAAQKILTILPETLLIIIPRHPERFAEVAELSHRQGFTTCNYRQLATEYSATTQVVIGDVMGQLMLFYALADVAFVGGSLVPWGGHNLLEPAALAKPVLSGPHLQAFTTIARLLRQAGGLQIVQDETALANQVYQFLTNPALGKQSGTAAWQVTQQHRGATTRLLAKIHQLL